MNQNTPKKFKKKQGIFSYLEQKLPLNQLFIDGLPMRYIPLVAYLFFLGLTYVGNTHFYERTADKVEHLTIEVDALRVNFMSLKSSYMLDSKQSNIAQRVAPLGIYESNYPPYVIKIIHGR